MKFREPIKDNFQPFLAVVALTIGLGVVGVSEVAQAHFVTGVLALAGSVTLVILIVRYVSRPPLR